MPKINALLLGAGGRENAIADALARSASLGSFFAAPGNPGISKFATLVDLDIFDYGGIRNFCKKNAINLVVVGPEQPLADGIADKLSSDNIPVFGPFQAAARLESSKVFAKEFMTKYKIPTADFQAFTNNDIDKAIKYIKSKITPIVLKADGLAAGKGVVIAENHDIAIETLKEMLAGKFGSAGEQVLIEDFMDGEEASIFAISDGMDFVVLASAQDHKRLLDGDEGPNTGGMGAYAPAPIIDDIMMNKVREKILKPFFNGALLDGLMYIGCLYVGLMIVDNDPFVVEFNVRFGDPEAQVVLPIFDGDFAALLHSAAIGNLDKSKIKNVEKGAAACIVLASKGYPGKYKKGYEISGIDEAEEKGAIIYHAGTLKEEAWTYTNGGRVIGVTAVADSLKLAVKKAYETVNMISFNNMIYRKDIAKKAFQKRKNI